MDRVTFLNSSGGIVTPFKPYFSLNDHVRIAETPLAVAPHVEQLVLPSVGVEPSALYGSRPENFALLTSSSGAALTFFCDSIPGGGDSGGDGSHDDPWRSMNTASRFLERNACVLRAAARYVQLKVRGVVDYVSGLWQPFFYYDRFILAGWGEKCDLGASGEFAARYLFDIRGRGRFDRAHLATYSDCTIVNGGGGASATAIDCVLDGGAELYCAWNCTGTSPSGYLTARVCSGGSFRHPVSAHYICSAVVSAASSGGDVTLTALHVRSAAVGVSVTAAGTATLRATVHGIAANYSACLAGCSVTVAASARGEASNVSARAYLVYSAADRVVVSGGSYTASANAAASASDTVAAAAAAGGFGASSLLNGVRMHLSAAAGAHLLGGSGDAYEEERLISGGTDCWESRSRQYSGGVVTSSWSESRCV